MKARHDQARDSLVAGGDGGRPCRVGGHGTTVLTGRLRMKPCMQPANSLNAPCNSPEFSLFSGGPFFRLLFRGQTPASKLTKARQHYIITIPLFVWLPLLALS